MALENALGELALDATLLNSIAKRFYVVTTATTAYSSSGDHTLVTAGASSIRCVWLYAQAKGALDTGLVVVTFTLGSNSYTCELTGSQPFAHSAVWEGTVGQDLVVNTSSTAAVIVNADYTLF